MTYDDAKRICEDANKMPLLRQYLTPAKNHNGDNGYCCPVCGSGTGEHGTGAVTIYGDHAKCFSCGYTLRNSDIAAHCLGLLDTKGDNFFKVAEFLARETGTSYLVSEPIPLSLRKPKKIEGATQVNEQQQPKKNYTKFYQYAESRLAEFISKKSGKWRGLSYDDLKAVRAGFAEREIDGEKVSCIILPHNEFSYFERSISDAPMKIKQHHGTPKKLFNPYDALNCGKPVFVVEGELDAITIHKFGYPAVALGGAKEGNLLLKDLSAVKEYPKFILLFDNNDGGVGQQAANELKDKLNSSGYKVVNFVLSPDLQYDANEFLEKDSVALSARLAEIYKLAAIEFETIENQRRGESEGFFFAQNYLKSTLRAARFADLQTGFTNLDAVQDFESGIITIGAPPSLGKTSFVWQLLRQIACSTVSFSKVHCVFVSYEMTKEILFSKTFAREIFNLLKSKNNDDDEFEPSENLSSGRLRKGIQFVPEYQDECFEVLEKLKNSNVDLRILDITTSPLKIDDLIKRLETIAASFDKDDFFVFAVDYLQIIPSDQENSKMATDYAMQELKKFTQRTNSICFLISSFNRNSYKLDTSFSAFKESGSIEYTSDVIWTLQLLTKDDTQETFDKAKMCQPRPMILKCLKNRFGNDYKIFFRYFSAVDCFIPCNESDLI